MRLLSYKKCEVPETIHAHPMAMSALLQRETGRGGIFKGKYEVKLEFTEGWGQQTKPSVDGRGRGVEMENCLEQHRQHNYDVLYIYMYQQRRCYQVVPFSLCPKR